MPESEYGTDDEIKAEISRMIEDGIIEIVGVNEEGELMLQLVKENDDDATNG